MVVSLGPLLGLLAPPLVSQDAISSRDNDLTIQGIVVDAASKPVKDAIVHLEGQSIKLSEDKLTDQQGAFVLAIHDTGDYSLRAEKLGKQSEPVTVAVANTHAATQIRLVIDRTIRAAAPAQNSETSSGKDIEFVDQPNFTIAGVTDFTAAGGHGSDSSLRTSEALARETFKLKPSERVTVSQISHPVSESENQLKSALVKDPAGFETNYRLGSFYLQAGRFSEAAPLLQSAYRIDNKNGENEYDLALTCKGLGDSLQAKKYILDLLSRTQSGDLYRLAGDVDESLGDPLAADREYQKAVALDPSEQNFFSWGSDLLIHRAIWQARQVFEQGAIHYPTSSRMLTGLGTALFAGAAYEEAALTLCQASDLDPVDQEPYIFLGRVQMAAPDRLACIGPKLRRFLEQQPNSATANYLYAMALEKGIDDSSPSSPSTQVEVFLRKAIAIDPGYADACLQLGILQASRKQYVEAIVLYKQAIAANPRLSDAYYRLAVAYDRTGQSSKAKEEFRLHDEAAKQQAADVERQRQEVKQFLVVSTPDGSNSSAQ